MKNPWLVARLMVIDDPNFLQDLWARYWANGGRADKFAFDALLQGLFTPDEFDHHILTWAFQDLSSRAGYDSRAVTCMKPELPPHRTKRPIIPAGAPASSN